MSAPITLSFPGPAAEWIYSHFPLDKKSSGAVMAQILLVARLRNPQVELEMVRCSEGSRIARLKNTCAYFSNCDDYANRNR